MPLYEYQCLACGLRFERRQSFSDAPVRICPDCGGVVERLIQPAGIIFKGSGFYVTDNRSKSSTAIPGSRRDGDGDEGASDGKSKNKSASESSSSSTTSESSSSEAKKKATT
jgi:putative FmdB family regulatory protein